MRLEDLSSLSCPNENSFSRWIAFSSTRFELLYPGLCDERILHLFLSFHKPREIETTYSLQEVTMMDLALLHASSQSVLRFDLPLIVLTVVALCPLLSAVVVDKPLVLVVDQEEDMDSTDTLDEANLESNEAILLGQDEIHDYHDHFAANGRHVGVKGSEHVNVYAKGERLPPVHHEHAQPLSAKPRPTAAQAAGRRRHRRVRVMGTK